MTGPRFHPPTELERRFDGPIPPPDPALAASPSAAGRSALFQRLAAEQRHAIARRRADIAAAALGGDKPLHRAARALHYYRAEGVGWSRGA